MKTLSLIDRDFNKGLWVAQMSFVFTRCGGYYKNEQNGEIEASFKFAASSELTLFFRALPSSDLSLFYNAITRDKFGFFEQLNYDATKALKIVDLSPNIGLACIFAKCSFPNAKIFAFNSDYADYKQMNKNFLVNGITNLFSPKAASGKHSENTTSNVAFWKENGLLDDIDLLIINSNQINLGLFGECINYLKIAKIIVVENCVDESNEYLPEFFLLMQENGFLNSQKGESMMLFKPGMITR